MLEAEIKELTAAMRENTEMLKTMNAGREEALAALIAKEGTATGAAATTTRRGRKPAAEAAATTSTEPESKGVAAATWNPDTSVDGMRAIVGPYLDQKDADVKAANAANVRAVLEHLGADCLNPIPAKPDAKALEGEDERRQAAFFITRFREGLTVDFSAEYDFTSDPCSQGDPEPAAEPAAAADDDLLG